MALTSSVTRKFDNNYVQVEINSNKYETRYYKVPESEADSFQAEYKKNSKKANRLSNGLMILGLAATTVAAYFATKKMENKALKTIISLVAGVSGGIAGTFAGAKIEAKDHQNLMYKYNATEIDYSQSNLPI